MPIVFSLSAAPMLNLQLTAQPHLACLAKQCSKLVQQALENQKSQNLILDQSDRNTPENIDLSQGPSNKQ